MLRSHPVPRPGRGEQLPRLVSHQLPAGAHRDAHEAVALGSLPGHRHRVRLPVARLAVLPGRPLLGVRFQDGPVLADPIHYLSRGGGHVHRLMAPLPVRPAETVLRRVPGRPLDLPPPRLPFVRFAQLGRDREWVRLPRQERVRLPLPQRCAGRRREKRRVTGFPPHLRHRHVSVRRLIPRLVLLPGVGDPDSGDGVRREPLRPGLPHAHLLLRFHAADVHVPLRSAHEGASCAQHLLEPGAEDESVEDDPRDPGDFDAPARAG
mmetsp:Transcript_51833/g.150771  ORF Transcript_51833/g.150771 Transcript_51833/m.150771 type:complete len:264 (+) Transcript_51833:1899-2690(+)